MATPDYTLVNLERAGWQFHLQKIILVTAVDPCGEILCLMEKISGKG